MSFWYLATPYSDYPLGRAFAVSHAAEQAAVLLKAGVVTYSPIAHTHLISFYGGFDELDHDFWMAADRPFMNAAHGLIVCKLDGWETSKGVAHEIAVFEKADKPVVMMTPGAAPRGLVGSL
jgi:hypothetical protein